VDGGSFDGSGVMLKQEFPEVMFVQAQSNLGFGASNNLGLAECTGDTILLLNPDTEICQSAVQGLMKALESSFDVVIVAPKLLNTDGSLQESCVQAFPTPLNQFLDSSLLRRIFPKASIWGTRALFTDTPSEVEAVSGACMLVRADILRDLRGFNTKFFMYGEDMDLCARIRARGMRVVHVPTAKVIHHGGGSSGGNFSRISALMLRQSIYIFISEHQGHLAARLYRGLIGISALLRLTFLNLARTLRLFTATAHSKASVMKWSTILRWSLHLEVPILGSPKTR